MSRAMTAFGGAEPLGDRVDDAQIGLVRNERGQLLGLDPGPPARLEGHRRHLRGGPAIDRLALLAEEVGRLVDGDGVGQRTRRCPRRSGPRPTSALGPTTAAPAPSPRMMQVVRSLKSIQPENRSAATTSTLRRVAGLHRRRRRAQRVHEARSSPSSRRRRRASRCRAGGPAAARRRAPGVGIVQVATSTRSMSAGLSAARGESVARGRLGHVDDRLAVGGVVPLGDADPAAGSTRRWCRPRARSGRRW